MMMVLVELFRYVLFGLFLYLCGKLFGKILTEYIFNPALYRDAPQECRPTRTMTPMYRKKAS